MDTDVQAINDGVIQFGDNLCESLR